MEEEYRGRLFSSFCSSYSDKRNTLSWALLIWAVTVAGFRTFMPIPATMVRSILVVAGWAAIHLIRRM